MYKIYLISAELDGAIYYKIGWTKRDPQKRLNELRTANSHNLEVIYTFETKWGPRIESMLHNYYSDLRCNGEWFRLSEQDVNDFILNCQKNHNILDCISSENSWFQTSKEFKKYL